MASKCFPYRPHDFMYDPIFTVSGPTDHYKAAIVAKMSAAKFQICPIFPNMFSDLPNHPRVQLVRRRGPPIPHYSEKAKHDDPALIRQVDVRGADRVRFFCPKITFPAKDTLPYMEFPTFTIEKIDKKSKVTTRMKSVHVETVYRESSAQTIPWQPPYTIIGEGSPEILKLDFLKWGSGLPAGMHEVQLIERARMKAAWEKVKKPNINDKNSLNEFRDYVDAMERDEWAFREQEIQDIQDLRLELLERMLNELHEKSKIRTEVKMKNFIAIKMAEKEEQLAKIRKKTSRELRKLETNRRGIIKKYRAVNIIEEHVDRKAEIYGPLMRHGEHPKRWHQVIDERMKKYRAQFIGDENEALKKRKIPKISNYATNMEHIYSDAEFKRKFHQIERLNVDFGIKQFAESEYYKKEKRHGGSPISSAEITCSHSYGVEEFSTLPRWLDQATKLKKRYLPPTRLGTRLCIKETRWSAPVLKELHEELKNLRQEIKKKPCSLRTRVEEPAEESYTPEVEGITEEEEDRYEALILLQSIIRGRATQMMIYEGRDTCKELIQELKYSVGLLKKEKELRGKQKLKVKSQQREEVMQLNMVESLQGTLGKLQGTIVGTLLDFLNKELRRLLEERKAHAMCLLNERERYIREAAEAGRRQKELRRRREHDEMFKQIVKVTQDTVDLYLQDIITEGMDFASTEEAKDYVEKLAEKIETETDEVYEEAAKIPVDEEDEIIADMVHHFILPEVQKILIRKKIQAQQKQKLQAVHEAIYSQFEDLPKVPITRTSEVSEYTMDITEGSTPTTGVEKEPLAGYRDPYEQYLRKLTDEPEMAHNFVIPDDTFNINPLDDDERLFLRHEDLDTITEVDTESTSGK